jgi:short-subunit dehydrogenase
MATSAGRLDARTVQQATKTSGWWKRRQIAGGRAIVTGASSGIGRAIALELARQGADLVITARRQERLEDLATEIRVLGRRVEIVAGDLTDAGVRQAALDGAEQTLGGLDILVNNAGVAALGRFEDANPDRLRQIFEVNFFSLVELTRAALPLLKRGRRPMVVNVGSILGHVAIPHLSEYCAAKFAVRGFSDALRAELHGSGVGVLLVSPATVETEIWERMLEQTAPTAWRSPRGLTAQAVATGTVWAIRRGHREVLPGLESKAFNLVNRLCPSLVAWALARRH